MTGTAKRDTALCLKTDGLEVSAGLQLRWKRSDPKSFAM